MTNFSFEFFYEIFTEDASLLFLYHAYIWCKKVKNGQKLKSRGPDPASEIKRFVGQADASKLPAPPRSPGRQPPLYLPTNAKNSNAPGRRTGACGNACRPPSRPQADCGTGCGGFKMKRRWLVGDLPRQQPAARHTATTNPRRRIGVDSNLVRSRLVRSRLVRSRLVHSRLVRSRPTRSVTSTARRRPFAVRRLSQPGPPWTNWWPSTLWTI